MTTWSLNHSSNLPLLRTCEKLDIKLASRDSDFAAIGSSQDVREYLRHVRYGFRHLLQAFSVQCKASFGSTPVDFIKEYTQFEYRLDKYLQKESPEDRHLDPYDSPAHEMKNLAENFRKLDRSLNTLIRGEDSKGASGLSLFIDDIQTYLEECVAQISACSSGKGWIIHYILLTHWSCRW